MLEGLGFEKLFEQKKQLLKKIENSIEACKKKI